MLFKKVYEEMTAVCHRPHSAYTVQVWVLSAVIVIDTIQMRKFGVIMRTECSMSSVCGRDYE